MNWLSLRNNWLKIGDFMRITSHFEIIYRIYFSLIKQSRKMSTCNRLDLESLGS